MDDLEGLAPDTIAVHAGRGPNEPGLTPNVPPVFTSIFKPGSELYYAREGNPTWTAFEEAIGALEGGRALAFASGMAAESAIFDSLEVGAKVVAPADAYYGTWIALQERADKGILEMTTLDLTDTEATIAALDGADLLWIESPSNPHIGICDIGTLTRAAHDRGIAVVVDNTFATPLLQQPLSLGADIVVHSATKFISGHSDVIMGVACTSDPKWFDALYDRRHHGGAIAGPMEAYLALRGLRTLPVRLEKGQANALELARRLEEHPRIERVLYPGLPSHPQHELATKQMSGFGAILSFLVDGDAKDTDRVCDSTKIIANMTSLGAVETTMERRARHPGEKAPENLVRMSVGCENVEDLWNDLASTLDF